ncbi:MAG: hypothetical protein QOJ29_380 [Thermoleophilaceae bacterium]|jgi:hypothetical protein|nr:hypothetical protein [Thermoleophilaceae bacterium]
MLALALAVAAAASLWLPWALQKRPVIAATPVPRALFTVTPVPLNAGQTACWSNVTFTPETQSGEIGLQTGGRPGPKLSITARGPGYRANSFIPAGYRDVPYARFPLMPPRHPSVGELCLRNTGTSSTNLAGTNEPRAVGRPGFVIDGVAPAAHASLVFWERDRSSYASRADEIFGRAATFTPGFFSKAILMAIAALALIGIPLGIAIALWHATRADDGRPD